MSCSLFGMTNDLKRGDKVFVDGLGEVKFVSHERPENYDPKSNIVFVKDLGWVRLTSTESKGQPRTYKTYLERQLPPSFHDDLINSIGFLAKHDNNK